MTQSQDPSEPVPQPELQAAAVATAATATATEGVALVTGGAGFIGSHLVRALVDRGWQVRAMDDLSGGRQGWSRLADVGLKGAERVEGSILDAVALARAMQGARVVFNLAGMPDGGDSLGRPVTHHALYATGTLLTLEAARRAGVERFIQGSTAAVYGDVSEARPALESDPPAPLRPAAAAHLAAERYVAQYARLYGLRATCLRYVSVYGPGQAAGRGVIGALVNEFVRGAQPVIHGDGEQRHEFCFIEDAVRATLAAMDLDAVGADGRALNVGGSWRGSINELMANLVELTSPPAGEPRHLPPRPGSRRRVWVDPKAAREMIGYEARVSIDDGLRRTIDWQRARGK